MKQIVWPLILTICFCILGVVGDNAFGAYNPIWNEIELAINIPGTVVLKLVGPGHGFRQLVFPFIFSLAVYFFIFWGLLSTLKRLRGRAGQ